MDEPPYERIFFTGRRRLRDASAYGTGRRRLRDKPPVTEAYGTEALGRASSRDSYTYAERYGTSLRDKPPYTGLL